MTTTNKKETKPRPPRTMKNRNYYRMSQVAELLGVTVQTIRNRERDGLIPALPRTPAGERRVPVDLVRQWIAGGGFPGAEKTAAPIPIPGGADSVRVVMPAAEADAGADLPPVATVESANGSEVISDDDYFESSMGVRRKRDELIQLKLDAEIAEAQRRLRRAENDGGGERGGSESVLAELIRANQALTVKMIELNNAGGQNAIAQTLQILSQVKELTTPVNLDDRPEGRLHKLVTDRIIEQILTTKEPRDNGDDGGGLFGTLSAILGKVAENVISGRVGVPKPQPGESPGAAATAGVGPVASADSPRIAEPPARPLLSEPKGGDELNPLDLLSDVFEAAGNMYKSAIEPEQAAIVLTNVLGDDPPVWLRAYFTKPATALIPVVAAVGNDDVADQLRSEPGVAWYAGLLTALAVHYGECKPLTEAAPSEVSDTTQ